MKKNFHKIIGIVILAFILYKINIAAVIELLSKTNIRYLIFVFIFAIPVIMLKSWRWCYLLKMQSINYDFKDAFLVYLSSGFLGIITPGKIGEFAKIFYIREDKGINIGKAFSSVFADRFLDLGVLLLFGFWGIFHFSIVQNTALLVLILLMFIFFLILLTNKQISTKLLQFVEQWHLLKGHRTKIKEYCNYFFDAIDDFKNIKLYIPVITTFIAYAIFYYQCYLMALSLEISISFLNVIFCISIANLISLIPISISGIGTRDASLIFLFSYLGLTKEAAVSFSIIFLFILYASVGVFGGIAWWMKPLKKIGQLRN